MKEYSFVFLAALFVLLFSLSACIQKATPVAPLDYGEEVMEYLMAQLTFDEVMQESDVLLVGTCISVEPGTPQKGYTRYTFSIEKDLAGVFREKEVFFCTPRAGIKLGNYSASIGTDEYIVGQKYLLPITRTIDVLDWVYLSPYPPISLNLSQAKYTLLGEDIRIPSGMTIEEYALYSYQKVLHEEKTLSTNEYASEFEEFMLESQLICRMKVERVVVKVSSDTVCFLNVEILNGDPKDLYSYMEEGWIAIGVIKGLELQIGKEYIVGFNPVQPNSSAYTMSTKTAVKEVTDDLLQRIADES